MTEDSEMRNTSSTEANPVVDVDFYRRLVKQFIEMRRYHTALFWAEKVCVLSQNSPKDVYCQAHCMFLLKEYHRAAHVIKFHELEKTHIPSYNLLLESLYEAKELNEAIAIINNSDIDCLGSSMMMQSMDGETSSTSIRMGNMGCDESKNEILASICYMKGKIYEAMDNRGKAMDYYVQALHRSVFCYEALEALVQHEMLMAWEEKELMQHLPLSQQSNDADAKLIRKLYESKLKKYYESLATNNSADSSAWANLSALKSVKEISDKIQKNISSDCSVHKSSISKLMTPAKSQIMSPAHSVLENIKNSPFSLHISLTRASSIFDADRSSLDTSSQSQQRRNRSKEPVGPNVLPLSECLTRIENSNDIMAAEAERLFYDCEYKRSCKILNELLKLDPYHNAALTVQIGCLAEFGDYNRLFYLAHKLVDRYPDKAISWYAVGCYYDLIGKSDPARRYLSKATSLDRLYGPAWLAYGHSFAKENEHDQAMAAYFKATQLMRGCHLPLLYIGVECGLTKNLELAEKFFHQAMSIAPLDVFVLHELGVIKYEYEYFESAEEVFRATVEIITKRAKENEEEISSRWEPLFNNLGHCCRKTKKYSEALKHHQFALLLKPQSASTYTAIGFIHALMGNLEDAVVNFHKSLAINRDCIVTSTILKICIEDMMEADSLIDQICGKPPKNYPTPKLFSSKSKRLSPIAESSGKPIKYNCLELKFDEEDTSPHSDNPDTSVLMDMSME